MCSDEFHEHAAECVGNVHDQPILVAAEVEDHAVVADEIDSRAELPLDIVRIAPPTFARQREPSADRPLGLRVALPELLQCSAGDHLHEEEISMSPNW
jgi:hypothetical protein